MPNNIKLLTDSCRAISAENFDFDEFESIFFAGYNLLSQEDYCNIGAKHHTILFRKLLNHIESSPHLCKRFSESTNNAVKRLMEAIMSIEMNILNDDSLSLNKLPLTSRYFKFCQERQIKPVGILTLPAFAKHIEKRLMSAIDNSDIDSYLAYLSCGISLEGRQGTREGLGASYFSALVKQTLKALTVFNKIDSHEKSEKLERAAKAARELVAQEMRKASQLVPVEEQESVQAVQEQAPRSALKEAKKMYRRCQKMLGAYFVQEGICYALREYFSIIQHVSFNRPELWGYFVNVSMNADDIDKLYRHKTYEDIKLFKNWLLDLMRSNPELCVALKKMENNHQQTQMSYFLRRGMTSGKSKNTTSYVAYLQILKSVTVQPEITPAPVVTPQPVVENNAMPTVSFYRNFILWLRAMPSEMLDDYLAVFIENATHNNNEKDPALLLCYLMVARQPQRDMENIYFRNFIESIKEHLLYFLPDEQNNQKLVRLMSALTKGERKRLKNNLFNMMITYKRSFMQGLMSGMGEDGALSALVVFMRIGRSSLQDKPSKSFIRLKKFVDQCRNELSTQAGAQSRGFSFFGYRSNRSNQSSLTLSPPVTPTSSPDNSFFGNPYLA